MRKFAAALLSLIVAATGGAVVAFTACTNGQDGKSARRVGKRPEWLRHRRMGL